MPTFLTWSLRALILTAGGDGFGTLRAEFSIMFAGLERNSPIHDPRHLHSQSPDEGGMQGFLRWRLWHAAPPLCSSTVKLGTLFPKKSPGRIATYNA